MNYTQVFKEPSNTEIKALKPSGIFNSNPIQNIGIKYDLSNEPPVKDRTLSFLVKNYVNQRSKI